MNKASPMKYSKDQLTHQASGVFVAINKSYFSLYTQLKEMALHLASIVCRAGFKLLAKNMVFRVMRILNPNLLL